MPETLDAFYITTPIYYVNDSPHIGHAYTTIAADVIARFMWLSGRESFFLTGTDEHGQKVDKAAKAAGIDPQVFTDEVSQRFRVLVNDPLQKDGGINLLNISNNDFIRTTEPRHKKAAQALWQRMHDNGWIYKAVYGGWYAVRDEAYYQEDELLEKHGKKIAPTGAEVEWVEEESWFFKLSAFQDTLLAFYDKNPDFVLPSSRYNEVKSFVKGGLKDLSISRTTFDWGIKVPQDKNTSVDCKHIMYVWVDALTNYLTAIGFPDDENGVAKFWGTRDKPVAVHIVGKDILRFHAVYWPAFLMAAELPCPRQIVAHGWWTIEGEKMSKSVGNVISPKELIDAYGLDAVRYFLMRAMPFGNDGDFSRERVVEMVNADLANNLGNLSQRVLKMIAKNCGGKIPEFTLNNDDKLLLDNIKVILVGAGSSVQSRQLQGVADALVNAGNKANEYIDTQAPWKLKDNPERRDSILYVLAEAIRLIAIYLQPLCPQSAEKMLMQLGYSEKLAKNCGIMFKEIENPLVSGAILPEPEGVFPRLEG